MLRWLEQYLIISRKSFTVFLGDPFVILLNLFFIGFTALIAGLPGFTFGEQVQLLRDQALAMAFSGGCLAATLGAAKLISEDMENGMISLIMSRPVRPSAFIFGRWTGIAGVIAVLTFTAMVSCLWATRIIHFEAEMEMLGLIVYSATVLLCLVFMAARHYFIRGSAFVWQTNLAIAFSICASFLILNFWGYNGRLPNNYGSLVDWKTAYAYIYIYLALCSFSAIICFLSVFLEQSILIIFGILLFFIGLFLRYFVEMIPEENARCVLMLFLPDWQKYWIADRLGWMASFPFFNISALFYQTFVQSILFLSFAIYIFRRREISGR